MGQLSRLSGHLPAELGSLPELRTLIPGMEWSEVWACGLTRRPPWGALRSSLTWTCLNVPAGDDYGLYSGPVPDELCNLTRLTFLNLGTRLFQRPPQTVHKAVTALLAGLLLQHPCAAKTSRFLGNLTSLKSLLLRAYPRSMSSERYRVHQG